MGPTTTPRDRSPSSLFGVGARDPATYAITSLLLIGAALVTIYVPVRRAVRVDPMRLCVKDGL